MVPGARRCGRDRATRPGAAPVGLTPDAVTPVLGALGVATIGAVVASRRPRHPVGWLLLAFGLCLEAGGGLMAYARYGLVRPGAIGAGVVVW